MGWACAPTVLYNAFRLQKRAKKSHKDFAGAVVTGQAAESLSRSLSTDDSSSENNSSVFNQDEDMQYQIEMMDQREQRCPCGCPGMQLNEERDAIKIKTKEKHGTNVLEDKVFGCDVLRFQGKHYCTEKVAPVWKKDCRMWLWKSSEKNRPNKRNEKEPRGCGRE